MDFIFDTTGLVSPVKFEELGAYFDHPTSAYTLSDYFDMNELQRSATLQAAIDNGEINAYDENGNTITNLQYLDGLIPVFDVDNINSSTSYVGYGTQSACKILRVKTIYSSTGASYTSLWASGDESFNKVWSGRTGYSYF